MKKSILMISFMLVIMVLANSCASYAVYKKSERKVLTRRALAIGDQAAIKAVKLGDDGVGVGIDITKWDTLTEQPLLQLGAAILDAIIAYGAYNGVKALDDSVNNSAPSTESGVKITFSDSNYNTVNIINGDNNNGNNDDNAISNGGEINQESN